MSENALGDEQAKAVAAVAKTAEKAIEATEGVRAWIGRVIGAPVEDGMGILGGDWLHHARVRNTARLQQRTDEILKQRGIKESAPVSLSIAVPLLRYAQDESRTELQDLFARLLANAMDSTRSGRVRLDVIEAVKKLEPLDALIFETMNAHGGGSSFAPTTRDFFVAQLKLSSDSIEVALMSLERLGLIERSSPAHMKFALSPFGRETIAACST